MLAKKFRLRLKKNFDSVMKGGRYIGHDFLAIKFRESGLEFSRFATAVTLKISKKATQRNKIKRRLQESIRTNLEKIKPGYDIIVFPSPQILKKDFQEIKDNLLTLLRKANLLK